MTKRFDVWWSEAKFYVPIALQAVLSAIFYWVGWSGSSATDSMPLARAGALATAVSIGFTVWRYNAILAAGAARGKAAFAKAVDAMNLQYVNKEQAKKNFDDKLDSATARIDQVITAVSVALLILATLVWGFGDLAKAYR
ncbi:hypothetical protein [Caulobacter zeae]|nr:hypothetical protein [Caulobacter zeae]